MKLNVRGRERENVRTFVYQTSSTVIFIVFNVFESQIKPLENSYIQ